MSGRHPVLHRAWASINLGALERNLQSIRSRMPEHLRYVSVVKANAYGHGLAPVVTRLMRARADAFAVANLEEAARLREVGEGWPIIVLSALLPAEVEAAVEMGVRPVISTVAEALAFEAAAARRGIRYAVHGKVDTGMGRLGIWHDHFRELVAALAECRSLQLEGLCTHFSAADKDPDYTRLQRERFLRCLDCLPDGGAGLMLHADNSAGVESFPVGGPFNAVRVGLLQFGVRPRPGSLLEPADVEPVLSFHARVGLVKELPAGTSISYGRTHTLERASRVAILTAGYADGIPTSLSNCGEALIAGHRCPILGRVTMDQTIVDVTDLPAVPDVGTVATLIGRDGAEAITVSDFAEASGKVEWEVFCSLSPRTIRTYRTDTAV